MKQGKRFMYLAVALILGSFLFGSSESFAKTPGEDQIEAYQAIVPMDRGRLISSKTFVDEDGAVITERTYYKASIGSDFDIMNVNGEATIMSTGGQGWIYKEGTYSFNTDKLVYQVSGYFVWGNGDVSVSSPYGYCKNIPYGITITNGSTKSGTGQYAWIFNKFAYVTYSCQSTNKAGMKHNHSVTLRISQSGREI